MPKFLNLYALILLIICTGYTTEAQTRYWVGGSGTWTNTANWSASSGGSGGVSVPISSNDVVFDGSSGFAVGNATITMPVGATSLCRNITFSSPVAPKLTGTGTLDVYGDMTLQAGMNLNTWTGNLTFYTDPVTPGLTHTLNTANNTFYNTNVKFNKNVAGIDGNYVVNGAYTAYVYTKIALLNKTNTVTFNQIATFGQLDHVTGTAHLMAGFANYNTTINTNSNGSVFKCYGNGTATNFNFGGEVYLNAGNTAGGNTYTINSVVLQYSQAPAWEILDYNNCTLNITSTYDDIGGNITPAQAGTVIATGSLLRAASTAAYFSCGPFVYNNVQVDDNLSGTEFSFYMSTLSKYTVASHTQLPSFNSLVVDRNCMFRNNYLTNFPLINTLLQLTGGHNYRTNANFTYTTNYRIYFNIGPTATLSMVGTCFKPIGLQYLSFELASGATVNSNYLITNDFYAQGPVAPYNAGANSTFIPGTITTGWTIGTPTHRNLVWVGAIPTNTNTVAQYGNWGDGNNWVDVTSNPTWASNVLIAPGNPSLTPACPPTWRDSVIMPDKSYINCNNPVSYCEGMNWLNKGRIYGTNVQDLEIWGSLYLSVAMLNDFGGTVKFRSEKRGVANWRNWITTNNQAFDYGVLFNSNDGLGEWVLQDSLKTTSVVGVTDPDCNSYLLELRSGHLHTGTAWCTPGNGNTIKTNSMYLHCGAISLYDSDVHITGIQGWHSGLDVMYKPNVWSDPTTKITVNAGTSNIILHNEEGPNVTGGGANVVSANFGWGHRWYDITLNMPAIGSYTSTAYTGTTHALVFREDTVRHVTAAYNTYPLITAISGGYAGGLISKLDLQNSNKFSYISAVQAGAGYANISNVSNITIDTLLAEGSVNFYIKTNIRNLLKLSAGKTYNLGTTPTGASAVAVHLMGASSTTVNPFYPIQCGLQPAFSYSNGATMITNGTCVNPVTINNGTFSATTSAMVTTTLTNLNITDNSVTGINRPLQYANSNLSGTTTDWYGTPTPARILRWKDASTLAGNSAMWNNSNYWELVSKSGPTTYSVVAPAPQCPPTKIDSVLFDNTSFSANNQIVDVNTGNVSNIIEIASVYWRNIAAGTNPQFSGLLTQNLSIYDNIEFHANMVQNFKGPILFRGTPTAFFPKSYITCNTKAFLNNITFTGDASTKNWTQKDAFNSPYNATIGNPTFSLSAGSYSTAGYPMNIAQFASYNASSAPCFLSIANSTVTINYQAPNWYDAWVVGLNQSSVSTAFFTLNSSNSFINIVPTAAVSAGALPRFCGGGKKYNNLTFTTNYGGAINRGGNGVGDEFNVVVFTGTANIGGNGTPNSIGDNYYSNAPDQSRFHKIIANGALTINAESCVFDSLLMNQGGNILGNEKYNKYVYFTDAKTYTFGSNRVQWFGNNCQVDLIGSAGNKIQLYSSTTGQQAYFRKDNSFFCADYINMRDIWAIGNGNNPAACASYTNAGPINTNCTPATSFSTHAVSSCDTITDLASSCGPWDVNNITRGRADFNAGSNADLTQGNNAGWANRGYPPTPSLVLGSYTTAICPTESVVLSFSGTGYVPFTLYYNTSSPSSTTTVVTSTLDATKVNTVTGVYTYTANCNCDGVMSLLSTTTTSTSFPLNLVFTCPTELDNYISSSSQLTSYNPTTGAFTYTTGVTPNQNTQYSLGYLLVDRCFNSKSAAGTGTVNVTLKPTPSAVIASSSPTTICNATPFNLNASATATTGVNSYTLFPTPTGTASPTAMTSYAVGAAVNGSVTIAAGTYTTGSSPSTYTVYAAATTSLGCTSLTRTPVQIIINPTPSVAITSTNVACFGNATGAVSYTASGGAGSGYSISPSITNLLAGTYNYTVTDANGCKTNTTAIITQPASSLTAITSNTANTSCTIPDGQAFVNPSGGTSAYTYTWSTGATTQTLTNLTGGTYSVTIKDNNNCTYTTQAVVANPSAPVIAASSNTNTICSGNNITITPSGGATTYSIIPSVGTATTVTGATIFTPTVTTSYTVVGTNSTSCLSNTVTLGVTVNATPVVTIAATSNTICNGQSTVLNLTGATSYTLLNTGSAITSGASFSPSATTTYTIQGSTAGCTSANTQQLITVNALPLVTAVSNSTAICTGQTATLTAGGATSYTWTSGPVTSTYTVNPVSNQTYTVSGKDANNCINTQTISLAVNALPNVTAVPSSAAICSGNTATLTAGGATSYTWTSGPSTATYTVATAGVYTVTGTDANNCVNTKTVSLTVNTTPTVAISASSGTICSGQTTTLTAATANNYAWTSGQSTNTISVAPTTNTVYVVVGTNTAGSCTATAQFSVTVNATPTVAISASSGTICSGQTTTLTAATANSYTWTSGQSTNTISVAPTTNTVYVVVGTNTAGSCTATSQYSVTVNATPTVAVTASNNTICIGGTTNLNLTGATTYTLLNTGSMIASGATFSPTTTTTYTVQGSTGNCTSSTTTKVITVNALPTVTAVPSATAICSGQTATLTAGGASTYTWTSGPTTSIYTLTPTAGTQIYTVTGKDANNCVNTQTVSLTVNITPTIAVSASSGTICSGQTTTLTAATANDYVWSTTSTANTTTVQPTTTTVYTVTGTNTAGSCTATANYTVAVNTKPDLTLTNTTNVICFGDANGTATVNTTGGTSGYNYTWTGSTSTVSVATGLSAGTHTAIVTDSKGCKDTLMVTIAAPSTSLSAAIATSTTGCNLSNGTATLTPTGGWNSGYTYVWQSSASTTNTATGYAAGSYTAQVTDANGCVKIQNFTISNPTTPTISALATSPTICSGSVTTITPSGAVSYSITGGTVSSPTVGTNFTVNPIANTVYSITGTDASNCISSTATVVINVNTTPTVAITASNNTICVGQNSTLNLSGATTYTLLNTGLPITTGVVFSPTTNTTYSIQGTTNNCNSSNTQQLITVNPLPIVTAISNATAICSGQAATLTAGGANTYTWTSPASSNTVITVSPVNTTNYMVTGTDVNNCINTQTISLLVNATPTVNLSASSATICSGSTTTLTVGTADNYVWSGGLPSTASNTVTPSSTTVYSVTGINTIGSCSATTQYTVTVNQLPTITASTITNVSCFGANNGIIDFTNTSGTPGYTVTGANVSGTTATGLSPANYTYTVTDAAGCVNTTTAAISQPTAPLMVSAAITSTNSSCTNPNGAFAISATGGTANYNYAIDGGSSTTNSVTTNLSSGIHSFIVTDANGCATTTGTVNIAGTPGITSSVNNQLDVVCYGNSTASITITGAGGSSYNYTLTPVTSTITAQSNTTGNFTGLSSGTYSVLVKEQMSNCISTNTITISQPGAPLSLTGLTTNSVICNGGSAQVTATVSGGTAPYAYVWSSNTSTTSVATYTAGNYDVNINDAHGCILATQNFTVNESPVLSIVSVVTTTTGCGLANGTATIMPTGGWSSYTYSVNGTAQVGNTISSLTAGQYTVDVADALGCSTTTVFTISNPTTPTLAIASDNLDICFGQTTTLTPTGAVSYLLDGTTPFTSNIMVNPTDTTVYQITGTDAANCTSAPITVTVNVNALPNLNVTSTSSVICSGQTATLTAQGADSYVWSTGTATINTIEVNPTSQTVYTVSGTNSITGCISSVPASYTVDVNQIPTVAVASQTNVTCFGDANGAITYTTNAIASSIAPSPTNLAAGLYTFTVTDNATSCSNTITATIAQPTATLGISSVATTTTGCGLSNGTATITAMNGWGSYTYSLNAVAQSTNTIANLAAGTYTAEVKDALGCITNTIFAIINPNSPTLNIAANPAPICHGNSITLTPTGATSYTLGATIFTTDITVNPTSTTVYQITGTDASSCVSTPLNVTVTVNALPTITVASSNTVICAGNTATYTATGADTYTWTGGLNSDTYTVMPTANQTITVTGTNTLTGCVSAIETVTVNVTQVPTVAIASQTNVTCYNDANGTVIFTTNAVSPLYTPATTGLSAGAYTFTITDNATTCTNTVAVSIAQPTTALTITSVLTTTTGCGLANGTATVNANGGWNTAYTYSVNGTSQSNPFTGLAAGTYTADVMDALGCTTQTTFVITNPFTPTLSIASNPTPICAGQNVTLTPTGAVSYTLNGTTPFTTDVTLNPGTTTIYTITGTDASSCTSAPLTVTVNVNSLPTVSISATSTAICSGSTITLTAQGADSYTWTSGPNTDTYSVNTAGTYTVTGTNTLTGCASFESSIAVTVNQSPTASVASQTNVLCYNGNNGEVSITTNASSSVITPAISGLTVGSYTFTVTDNETSCTNTVEVAITGPTSPLGAIITNTTANASCAAPNGAFTITATGGTPNYTYNTTNATGVFTGQSTGMQTINVADANGCTTTVTVNITGANTPSLAATSQTNVLCNNQSTGAASVTVVGGTLPYNYNWTNNPSTTNAITNVTPNTYVVTITDAGNCIITQTITITEPSPINAITTSVVSPCVGQSNGSASIDVTGGTPNYSYNWTNTSSTTSSINDVPEGQYIATITDANGCTYQYPVQLTAENGLGCVLQIPEIYSPNGDGKNDTWEIKGLDNYPNNTVQIFNRWGDEVYKAEPYKNDWDGNNIGDKSLLGKGTLPVGTYYFILDLGNGDKPITGYVQLTK